MIELEWSQKIVLVLCFAGICWFLGTIIDELRRIRIAIERHQTKKEKDKQHDKIMFSLNVLNGHLLDMKELSAKTSYNTYRTSSSAQYLTSILAEERKQEDKPKVIL